MVPLQKWRVSRFANLPNKPKVPRRYTNQVIRDRAQRESIAFDRLLAQFGVSRNADRDALADAVKRMVEGLSESYRERLGADAAEQPVDKTY